MVKLLLSKGAKLEVSSFHSYKEVNFHFIKYLLKRGVNPKTTYDYGYTLLHKQCKNGNLKNVKYLIQHYNADVSAKNWEEQTPLHLACRWNNLRIVKFLIEEQNADPAVTCKDGKSALHYAAERSDLSILRYLINVKKQDIEATDNEGKTVLHIACKSFSWATQKYLVEEHPKIIEAKDKKGKTALYNCLEHFVGKEKYEFDNFRPIALILAAKSKILKTLENKETDHVFDWIKQSYGVIMKKIETNHDHIFDWIIQSLKKSKGEDEVVSCLIAGLQHFHKKLDKKDENRIDLNALLYLALYCNRTDIAKFMFNQDLCYIEKHFKAEEAKTKRILLLKSYLEFSCDNGFLDLTTNFIQEINNKQESFQNLRFDGSFLRSACKNKHIDIFKYLLEDEKAKEEAVQFFKVFPLHFACRNGSLDMVQYLLEIKQIDIEGKEKDGSTLLQCACHAGSIEMAKYLIEKRNANVNITDNKGRKLWHFACKSDCLKLVKSISEKTNLDVNAQDEDGSTALHHLACEDYWNLKGQYKSNLKAVKFLVTDMKANHHLVDKEGRTPLHVHCQSTWTEVSIVKFLVNHGANVLAKDKSRKSPLQIAKSKLEDPELEPHIVELITFLKAATKR
jgi:ankyrin repeat protein